MGLQSASLFFGNALSFFLAGWFFRNFTDPEMIKIALHNMLETHTALMLFGFIVFQLTMRSKPEHPPSAVATEPEQNLSFMVGFRELGRNRSLLLLTISFAATFGLYLSLANVMSSIFEPVGFTVI